MTNIWKSGNAYCLMLIVSCIYVLDYYHVAKCKYIMSNKRKQKSGLKLEYVSEFLKEFWRRKLLDLDVLDGTWKYHISNSLSSDANVAYLMMDCYLEVHTLPSHL